MVFLLKLSVFVSMIMLVELTGPIIVRKPGFLIDVRANSRKRERRNTPDELCCWITECKGISLQTENHNIFQCYKRTVCGEICENNRQRSDSPRYRKREFYVKRICGFKECNNYRIDCRPCPNPDRVGFDIQSLSNQCEGCYI